jgi:hypothetical protein
MAVIATEGFDHYASFANAILRVGNLGWSAFVTPTIVTPGRSGFGKCLSIQVGTGGGVTASFNANLATYYIGFAMMGVDAPTSFNVRMYDPIASGTMQCSVQFNFTGGLVSLFRGSTQLAISSPALFSTNAWTFVEIMATIDNTAGAMAVRLNNQPAVSVSGVDTQTSTNPSWGGVNFFPDLGSGAVLIDDFRYNDTSTGPGTYPNNSWIGDMRVATLFPTANATPIDWTPLTGANWQEVSETAFDGDTSYNATATAGDEDLFNLGTLSAVIDQIASVQLITGAREVDAGSHTFSQQLSVGGTDHSGATNALGVGYTFFSDMFPVNPTTGASWTLADVNSMLAGYKAVS